MPQQSSDLPYVADVRTTGPRREVLAALESVGPVVETCAAVKIGEHAGFVLHVMRQLPILHGVPLRPVHGRRWRDSAI